MLNDAYLDHEGKNSNELSGGFLKYDHSEPLGEVFHMPLGRHLFRFTGSDQLQDITQCQINAIFEDMGSVDFTTRDFILFCSENAGCSFITCLRV